RRAPRGAVLLAAGRGSRLGSLTAKTHKSLLPVAGKPALGYAVEAMLERGVQDVVVVTGDKAESIEAYLAPRFGERVRLAHNARFAEDTNILSTEIGVEALKDPLAGYLVVETDLVIEPAGWRAILDLPNLERSFWVTRGIYHEGLTGGALDAEASGAVREIVYAPAFEERYRGWHKLLGIVYVGSEIAARDRELRQRAVARTIAQYYMMPWVEHLEQLPCSVLALGEDVYAASFNDLEAYRETGRRFEQIVGVSG
ncbi:MAG: NTP transferase domain-containing protein, partial [Acidobacteriota bacterium]